MNDERSDRMNDEPARLSRHSVGPLVTTSFGLRSSLIRLSAREGMTKEEPNDGGG